MSAIDEAGAVFKQFTIAEEVDERGIDIITSVQVKHSTLTVKYMNGEICVNMGGSWTALAFKLNGEWIIDEHTEKLIPNYIIFKAVERRLLADEKNYGAYILVNDDTSRFLHETFDSAWRFRTHDYAYVGRIGSDDVPGEVLLKNLQIL